MKKIFETINSAIKLHFANFPINTYLTNLLSSLHFY